MRSISFVGCVVLVACGTASSSPEPSSNGPTPQPTASPITTPTTPPGPAPSTPPRSDASPSDPSDGSVATDASDAGTNVDAATAVATASCASLAPVGTPRAAPLPTYAGTCPTLAAAPAYTTITSSGATRKFLVFRPTTPVVGEKLPVVFLYHWLGGSPEDMANKLAVQAAVDARRFIGVIPDPKGDALFRWPFEASQSQARVDEEAVFFDDMLACVGAALPVEKECVSSVGVSAGALWTGQLATLRSQRLASIVSLSGGVGGASDIVRPWGPAAHKLPALVLWGGSGDTYPSQVPIMNFDRASRRLESSLTGEGHFLVECVHNCGHAVPPFDPPPIGGVVFDAVWRFVLDHPYWLAPGQSPYATRAFPAGFPSWCAKGQGSAVPRPGTAVCP